jgi:UDP-2,3-diacylglucosamine pyrophosphatase LpxH
MKVKTLFISDVHLGSIKSRPDKLLKVFKEYEFQDLVIIGDFIDLTALKRKIYWDDNHSAVLQKILKMSRKGIGVHYILGNHDFYLRDFIKEEDIEIGNIKICDEMTYETSKGEKIYICHGDQFDGFIRIHPIIYYFGDIAYEFSYSVNRVYNKVRNLLGLNYWSLSKYLKTKVKNAILYLNDFKHIAIKKIENSECHSIMIGHIHNPAIEKIGDNTYYNSGDFCESCSFLYEDYEGDIHLVVLDS